MLECLGYVDLPAHTGSGGFDHAAVHGRRQRRLHGAAKSLIAASHLERLAQERGMSLRAEFAGTEPDPQLTPAAVAGLQAEKIHVRGQRPRRVTADDIRSASRVVSFGCDLDALAPGIAVERWDDVPAVSENYRAARDVIVSRLPALLEHSDGARNR